MTVVAEFDNVLFRTDGVSIRRIFPVDGGRRYMAELSTGDGLLLDGSAVDLFAAAKAEAERKARGGDGVAAVVPGQVRR